MRPSLLRIAGASAAALLLGGLGLAAASWGLPDGVGEIALVQPAFAQEAPDATDADGQIVARVGDTTITVGEMNRRLAETPRSHLAGFGSTPEEVKKNFLERVLVRDAILAEEAKARGLDKHRDVRDRNLGALRAMILHDVRTTSRAETISDEEVKAYFDSHKADFTAPKRVGLFRILVATEAEAKSLLDELGEKPDPKKWNDLARDKSLDKSNHLRGGNLGSVAEDGTTGQAENRVDPALLAAAAKVKDGMLVPTPVKEGDRWAVIWKRQSLSPVSRSLEIEAPSIRAAIADQRLRDGMQALLDKLRPELVKELNVELCDMVTVTPRGELERAKRPGALPRTRRPANAAPQEGPGGLR